MAFRLYSDDGSGGITFESSIDGVIKTTVSTPKNQAPSGSINLSRIHKLESILEDVGPVGAFSVSDACINTYPCQHEVTFYRDTPEIGVTGNSGQTWKMYAGEIRRLFTALGLDVPAHFIDISKYNFTSVRNPPRWPEDFLEYQK